MRQIIKMTLLCLAISPLLSAADYRFVRIDFPHATQTLANGINARGDIVGSYLDAGCRPRVPAAQRCLFHYRMPSH